MYNRQRQLNLLVLFLVSALLFLTACSTIEVGTEPPPTQEDQFPAALTHEEPTLTPVGQVPQMGAHPPEDVQRYFDGWPEGYKLAINEDVVAIFTFPDSTAQFVSGALIYHIPSASSVVLDFEGNVDSRYTRYESDGAQTRLEAVLANADLRTCLQTRINDIWGPLLNEASAEPSDPILEFEALLMQAVQTHDFGAMQSLMGDSFGLAGWRSEGWTYTPSEAIEQLRVDHLKSDNTIRFQDGPDLGQQLEGRNILSVWDPAVNPISALFSLGWGTDGKAEAFLIIAQRPDGTVYWEGILIALSGFVDSAVEQPVIEPSVTISPLGGPPGSLVQVVASGFPPNTLVSVGVGPANSEFSQAAQGTTDVNGTFVVQVPVEGDPGMNLVFAVAVERQPGVSAPDLFYITGAVPTVIPTPTPYQDMWTTFSSLAYAISLQYPADWQPVPGYGDPEAGETRFGAINGFFQVGAMDADTIDAATAAEAEHKLQPYGSQPTIETLQIQGQEARLVLPSNDQPTGMQHQAALIIRYSQPVNVAGTPCRYFVLWADGAHIRTIAQTLHFTN